MTDHQHGLDPELPFITTKLEWLIQWARKSAIWPAQRGKRVALPRCYRRSGFATVLPGHEMLAQAACVRTGGPVAAAIRQQMACGGRRGKRTGQVRSKCSTGMPRAAAIFCKVA